MEGPVKRNFPKAAVGFAYRFNGLCVYRFLLSYDPASCHSSAVPPAHVESYFGFQTVLCSTCRGKLSTVPYHGKVLGSGNYKQFVEAGISPLARRVRCTVPSWGLEELFCTQGRSPPTLSSSYVVVVQIRKGRRRLVPLGFERCPLALLRPWPSFPQSINHILGQSSSSGLSR